MKSPSPLARLLTSRARARLLLFFAVIPDDRLGFREIQRRTGLGSRSLQRELGRLESLGLVKREGIGRSTRYCARTEGSGWLATWRAVSAFAEPVEVMEIVLAGLPGVESAFIYGSTARGDVRPDSDIDLFLVGDGVDEIELARRTNEAAALVGRQVDTVVYSRSELEERLRAGNPYLGRVLLQPRIWLQGDDRSLPRAA